MLDYRLGKRSLSVFKLTQSFSYSARSSIPPIFNFPFADSLSVIDSSLVHFPNALNR